LLGLFDRISGHLSRRDLRHAAASQGVRLNSVQRMRGNVAVNAERETAFEARSITQGTVTIRDPERGWTNIAASASRRTVINFAPIGVSDDQSNCQADTTSLFCGQAHANNKAIRLPHK